MENAVVTTPAESRPYRSHKVPACDLCRHRKIRCNIDIPGQPCRFCRERELTCEYTQKTEHNDAESPAKRRKTQAAASFPMGVSRTAEKGLAQFPSVAGTSPTESSLILNPPMAEDIEILEHYLTSNGPGSASTGKPYSLISSGPGNPIVYLTVPRRRKGLPTVADPGRSQREVIEQILGPFKEDVINLYFDKLHPCFPILDEKTFTEVWGKDPNRLSSTLVCDIYASALHFWNTSEKLKCHPRPDLVYIWNSAVAAIQEDFLGSTISTVHASLLDLIGRPVLSITGNIVTLGRTVTLAHSLGLHRDPTTWKATEHEKSVRIRLWWGVLIHDYWSSLAHGTPPLIHRQNCDVPLPKVESLLTTDASETHQRSAHSFLHLCLLSRILGDLLPFVYALQPDHEQVSRHVRRLEVLLDDWETSLPDFLNIGATHEFVNGASSLHFCFLSLKLLLCRIAFKETSKSGLAEARSYRLAMLREAASVLTEFVCSLDAVQLGEFWLPYTAHLLVSATTILLRCLLESTDLAAKKDCAGKLLRLKRRLETARQASEWDLADFCLERCSEPINKIASAMGILTDQPLLHSTTEPAASHDRDAFDTDATFTDLPSEFFLPVDSLDYPFDALWDVSM